MKISRLISILLITLSACTSKQEPQSERESAEVNQTGKVDIQITNSTVPGIVPGDKFNDLVVSALSTGKYSFLRGTKVSIPSPTPTVAPTPTPTIAPTPTPTIAPTPTPIPTPTPGSIPLPDKAKWESNMLVKGQQAWDELKAGIAQWKTTGVIDPALGPTYYDMQRVFYQIYEYTGDAKWLQAAADADSVYGYWVSANGGKVSGYWNFSQGFLLNFQKTASAAAKTNLVSLQNAAYCPVGTTIAWTTSAGRSREVAYCVNAMNNAITAGGTADIARRNLLVTQQISDTSTGTDGTNPYPKGHIYQWLDETYRAPTTGFDVPACAGLYYFQPFMAFLTTESLIRTWNLTHDPRILPAVKAIADYTWTKAWVPASKAFWYDNCYMPGPGASFPLKNGAPDLNLLAVSTWGWLYQQTKDPKYLSQGDQIWSGGVTQAYLEQGKQFNQNYTFSFDYPKCRDLSATTRKGKK